MVLTSTLVMAQSGANLLAGKDLSTIKVESLTDAELSQIQAQLKQSGVSIDMVEAQAIAKGMSPEEFAKLKERVNGISGLVMAKSVKKGNINSQNGTTNLSKDKDSTSDSNVNTNINTLIYGSKINNKPNRFVTIFLIC